MEIIITALSVLLIVWHSNRTTNTLITAANAGLCGDYVAFASIRGVVVGPEVPAGVIAHEEYHARWAHPWIIFGMSVVSTASIVYALASCDWWLAVYLYVMWTVLSLVVLNYIEILADRAGALSTSDYADDLIRTVDNTPGGNVNYAWHAWFQGHPPINFRLWWIARCQNA